jgi:hypothetical protein
MFEIRAERKKLADRDKELVAEWESLEAILLGRLEEQGSVRVSSKQGTASIGTQVLPIVEDWDEYWAYMRDNDAPHLLQRRPAVNAYRELLEVALKEAGIDDLEKALEEGKELPVVVPGTRPVVKKSINLRAS